jgi:hypothetical protein
VSTRPQLREAPEHDLDDDVGTRLSERVAQRFDVVAVVVVSLPIALAAVRAAATGWLPIGDDAYFTLRSMDVGTEHHPLLGAWSSGSIDVDRLVNNLGPLQLDLLAPFTRWTPYGGTAIGVACVQIAALVVTAWLVHSLAGSRGTVLAMVPVGLMTWTLGSEMLITTRQHQYLVPTYLCFLVAAWASAAGRRHSTIPLVVTASLLTQTHLSYPILVASVGVAAVVGQIIAWRATEQRAEYVRSWFVAGAVAAVLWVQTLIDQLWGWGNLGDVLAAPGGADRPGTVRALAVVGQVLVAPRGYLRPGFKTFDPETMSARWPAVLPFVVFGVLVAGAVWTIRDHRRTATAGLVVASLAVGASMLNATQLPITFFGLTAANYRWLWPTGTFLLVGGAAALGRYWNARHVPAVGLALVVVIASLNVPRSVQQPDPGRYLNDQNIAAAMIDQLDSVAMDGPVRIDQQHMFFGHPFGYPLAVALRDRGIDYRFDGEVQWRRFGRDRVADGDEPTTLELWWGADARERRDDPRTVVYVDAVAPLAILMHDAANASDLEHSDITGGPT